MQAQEQIQRGHHHMESRQPVDHSPIRDKCVRCCQGDRKLIGMPCCGSCSLCRHCVLALTMHGIGTNTVLTCLSCGARIGKPNTIAFKVHCRVCMICKSQCDWAFKGCRAPCPRNAMSLNPLDPLRIQLIEPGHRVIHTQITEHHQIGQDIRVILDRHICLGYGYGPTSANQYLLKPDGSVEFFDTHTNAWEPWSMNPPRWFPGLTTRVSP